MTDEQLNDYVARALVVAHSYDNQEIINLLVEVQDWINSAGTIQRPDLQKLEQLGLNGNPKSLQLYEWLMERK